LLTSSLSDSPDDACSITVETYPGNWIGMCWQGSYAFATSNIPQFDSFVE